MILEWSEYRFYLKPGETDMRKAVNGLTIIIQNEMALSPFSRNMYLFCNRRKKILRIIYWDRNGFCMWQKKLEKQRFPWPDSVEKAREINFEQIRMLLQGIDFFHAHQDLSFSRV
jgi:transposase